MVGNTILDGIGVANQMILGWGDYRGLLKWAQCNCKSPYLQGGRWKSQNQRDGIVIKIQLAFGGFRKV